MADMTVPEAEHAGDAAPVADRDLRPSPDPVSPERVANGVLDNVVAAVKQAMAQLPDLPGHPRVGGVRSTLEVVSNMLCAEQGV